MNSGFLPGIFFRGNLLLCKFLLFSDKISGGEAKVSEGGSKLLKGRPLWKKAKIILQVYQIMGFEPMYKNVTKGMLLSFLYVCDISGKDKCVASNEVVSYFQVLTTNNFHMSGVVPCQQNHMEISGQCLQQ